MGIQERKDREKEHRKEEIVDAAQKIFFEKGLLTATMDEIAETAELSKGTLYLYYKSKEDLYLAVNVRGIEILYAMVDQTVKSKESLIGKLRALQNVYFDFFEKHKNFFRMFYFFQTSQFHKQVSDEMREMCSAKTHQVWTLVIDLLKKGIGEGLIRPNLDPVEITIILWLSATSLMQRIDNEDQMWKERMKINLKNTLKTSNLLLFEAILTEAGRKELSTLEFVK